MSDIEKVDTGKSLIEMRKETLGVTDLELNPIMEMAQMYKDTDNDVQAIRQEAQETEAEPSALAISRAVLPLQRFKYDLLKSIGDKITPPTAAVREEFESQQPVTVVINQLSDPLLSQKARMLLENAERDQ